MISGFSFLTIDKKHLFNFIKEFIMSLKKIVVPALMAVVSVSAMAADAPTFDTGTITDTIASVATAFGVIGAAYISVPIIKWGWKKVASFF